MLFVPATILSKVTADKNKHLEAAFHDSQRLSSGRGPERAVAPAANCYVRQLNLSIEVSLASMVSITSKVTPLSFARKSIKIISALLSTN